MKKLRKQRALKAKKNISFEDEDEVDEDDDNDDDDDEEEDPFCYDLPDEYELEVTKSAQKHHRANPVKHKAKKNK
jgi:hypothetical protein